MKTLTMILLALILSSMHTINADEPMTEQNGEKLFDGKTLDGWRISDPKVGKEQWLVEDGTIIAENKGGAGTDLWTKKDYVDFDLTLEYKTLSDDYDTGVFLRGGDPQVQIGISGSLKIDLTACVYAPKDKKGSYPINKNEEVVKLNKVGEWNTLRIILKGKRIQTYLNGESINDYKSLTISDKGPIGLQIHKGRKMKVLFRDITVQELK